ncbi:hypothetical protein NQ317_007700 [Molorchus minor]|uniref:Transposable element P transposase n=1 Tax=Molorchus minor TaxID=1323400 RepID=A0ABQ9JRB1_9CUCU|nr:hypothetical protein NQ317_007700 [Molorchus minor]
MKVKMASQVFSARVAAAMRSLALHGQSDKMMEDALDTAEFILFMDKAFDSVNGARVIPESGKSVRTAVTEKSDHKEFWTEAIKVFESMVFLDSKMKEHITPSIKIWTHTLKALRYICTKLLGEGFKFVCPRNFNQDPLENFFGCIRAHGVRNVNPSCNSFVGSLKSLIICNFMIPHQGIVNQMI